MNNKNIVETSENDIQYDDKLGDKVRASINKLEPDEGASSRMYLNILEKTQKKKKSAEKIYRFALQAAIPAAACVCFILVGLSSLINKNRETVSGESGSGYYGNSDVMLGNEGDMVEGKQNFTDEGNLEGGAMIANPFVEVEDSSAFEKIGITLEAPDDAEITGYTIIDNEIAQVEFTISGHEYTLRASYLDGDFAGVYGKEKSSEIIDSRNSACMYVVLSGTEKWYKVYWTDGRINYYLINLDGAGQEEVKSIVKDELLK